MADKKTIILCADDYGLNEVISQGICQLLARQRLSLTSCLVNQPDLENYAQGLLQVATRDQIGLHINLTEGEFVAVPGKHLFSLKELLWKTHLAKMDVALLRKEMNAQLDRFCQAFGQLPAFIDGHQHIQQLPQLRQLILELYQQRLSGSAVRVRCSFPVVHAGHYRLKARILNALGGRAFKKLLLKQAIPHYPCFSGVYNFSETSDYRSLFQSWLREAPDMTLIMCHPALENSPHDPIAKSRWQEFCYFNSEFFVEDCALAAVGGVEQAQQRDSVNV